MSAKRSKIDTRTMLYILIVVLIVIGAYYFISNMSEPEKWYSPGDVRENLVGQKINVQGFYEPDLYDGSIVSDYNNVDEGFLRVDLSNVDSNLLPLKTQTKFKFTGELQEITGEFQGLTVLILMAESVDEV